MTRDELIQALAKEQIQTRPVWGLIHEQKPYVKDEKYKIEQAYFYQKSVINIPCSSNLLTEDILYVVETLKRIVNR